MLGNGVEIDARESGGWQNVCQGGAAFSANCAVAPRAKNGKEVEHLSARQDAELLLAARPAASHPDRDCTKQTNEGGLQ